MASPTSTAILQQIPEASLPYPLLRTDESRGRKDHTHAPLPAESFEVRGATYLRDKKKGPSGGPMFDLMHVDMLRSESKMGNVASRSDSWLRRARAAGDTRFYLVVTYVTTASPFIHLVIYLAVQPERVAGNPNFAGLWQRFTAEGPEGDAFRYERWKVIPRIQEGAWIVKTAVGTVPALLGTKLTHTWVTCPSTEGGAGGAAQGGGGGGGGAASPGTSPSDKVASFTVPATSGPGPYLEADCDVASSTAAGILVGLVQGYAKCVVARVSASACLSFPPSPPPFVFFLSPTTLFCSPTTLSFCVGP
jgi:hypothetical protein